MSRMMGKWWALRACFDAVATIYCGIYNNQQFWLMKITE